MLGNAWIITKLLQDHWEELLLQDVLIPLIINGSVFGCVMQLSLEGHSHNSSLQALCVELWPLSVSAG